ncbi:MAG: hypothetical protein Fur0022_05890 [Anaerolineales bacterium]
MGTSYQLIYLIPDSQSLMSTSTRQTLSRILALAFVVGISVWIFLTRDQIEDLAVYGYPGAFLFSALTSATVILPAPGLLVVYALGSALNPIGVGIAAGLGAAIGELSGYLAGYSGRAVIENAQAYERIRAWMESHKRASGWLIFLLAFLPITLFDVAGMAAGALKMPVWWFLAWETPGKILKMIIVAYLGAYSIHLFGF